MVNPSAPPLLRQFTNIWNIPHLKNGLRIIYSIIVTLLYRDHPQRNCALSSPLNASLVSLRSSTLEKKTAGESKILFGISRRSKRAEPICSEYAAQKWLDGIQPWWGWKALTGVGRCWNPLQRWNSPLESVSPCKLVALDKVTMQLTIKRTIRICKYPPQWLYQWFVVAK